MSLRDWQAIRRDTGDTEDDGAMIVVNPSYYIDGELARRPGTLKFAAQSGTLITNFWSPFTGLCVVFVNGGNVEMLPAP